MVNIADALKVKPKQWVAGVIMCVGTVAPGLLVVYQFRPDLFLALGAVKLAMLAIALTLPLVLLNAVVVVPRILMHGKIDLDSDNLIDPGELYLAACGASGVVLYPAIAAAHFMELPFGLFCIGVVALEAAIAAWHWGSLLMVTKR